MIDLLDKQIIRFIMKMKEERISVAIYLSNFVMFPLEFRGQKNIVKMEMYASKVLIIIFID